MRRSKREKIEMWERMEVTAEAGVSIAVWNKQEAR